MDQALHEERVLKERAQFKFVEIPNGCIFDLHNVPYLKWENKAYPWAIDTGYGQAIPIKGNPELKVLTPPSTMKVLKAGYQPVVNI